MSARLLSFGSIGGMAVYGLFLIQNLLAPGTEPGQWQGRAYDAAFIAIIALFAVLFLFSSFLARRTPKGPRYAAYVLVLGPILAASAAITSLDVSLGTRDFISMFAVLLGVCVFVSAPAVCYLAMGAWSAAWFFLGCALIPDCPQTAYTTLTAVVVVSVGAGFGAYLDRVRVQSLVVAHEMQEMSLRDPLTCAYNRRFLDETLEAHVARAARYGEDLSLLVLDVDRFKSVNDEFGHAAGDALLKALSGAAQSALRSSDVFARFGGDEFAVILPRTKRQDALIVAEKLRAAAADLALPGTTRKFTISVGAASLGAGETRPCLVSRADSALYRAKAAGRNAACLDTGEPERSA